MQRPLNQEDLKMLPRLSDAPESPYSYALNEEGRVTVYIWDWPVRITHWVNVFSVLLLSLTGFFISNPFMGTTGEANTEFLMGTIRFVHFLFGFVLTCSVLFRFYWALVDTKYARLNELIPFSRARRRGILKMLGYYAFVRREPPAVVGHNPMAGTAYAVVFSLFMVQVFTGYALYSQAHTGTIWNTLFGWMIALFGSQAIRLVHDLVMWLLIAFTFQHIYSALLCDIEERSGLVSSIVTGFKLLTPHHIHLARLEAKDDKPRRKSKVRK